MRFLGHLILFYCAFIASLLASLFIKVLIPSLGQAPIPWAAALFGEPAWILEIVTCLLVGYFSYKRMPGKSAFIVWLVPFVFLVWSAWSWHLTMSEYDSVWDTYFGKGCGGSECLYQLMLTGPSYSSVTYSFGALASSYLSQRTSGRESTFSSPV